MLNTRVFPFVAPNEEPKWGILVFTMLVIAALCAVGLWRSRLRVSVPLHLPGLLLTVFYLLLFIGIWIGVNPVEGAIRFAFWFAALTVWLVSVWVGRHGGQWHGICHWLIAIASASFSMHYWWNYLLDYGKPNYNVSVLFSPIGHVNFTGDVLVLLFPYLIWALATLPNPSLKVLNWFSTFTAACILLVSATRGALGGLFVGLIVLLPMIIRHRRALLRKGCIPAALWVGTALFFSGVAYFNLPFHFRELVRVSATLKAAVESPKPEVEQPANAPQPPLAGLWRKLSPVLTTRTPIYAASTAMIADKPWLGHGTGNFFALYPGYSNRFPEFRDPLSTDRTFTTNPHNVFLQIATQNGLPAAIIFTGLLIWFALRLYIAVWRQWDAKLASGVMALTAAIIDAMVNHVFFNPASMFVFALLGGMWWAALPAGKTFALFELPRPKVWAGVILIAALALAFWPLRWVASEWYVGKGMQLVRQPMLARPYYDLAYALDPYNFRAVFGAAQVRYAAKEYQACIERLLWFEKIYPYNSPALNMLGAAYMMSGKWHEAERYFKKAIETYPDSAMAKQNLQRVTAIMRLRRLHPAPTPRLGPAGRRP